MLKVARAGFALLLLLFLGNQRNSGGAERQHLLHSVTTSATARVVRRLAGRSV